MLEGGLLFSGVRVMNPRDPALSGIVFLMWPRSLTPGTWVSAASVSHERGAALTMLLNVGLLLRKCRRPLCHGAGVVVAHFVVFSHDITII